MEYPNVLAAKFEERFLAVPAEALVYTMKGDQKYFPIYDKDGKLLPHFILYRTSILKIQQQLSKGMKKWFAHV